MITLSEFLPPRPEPMWQLIKQCGVDTVVATLNGGEQDQRMFASVGKKGFSGSAAENPPWEAQAIKRDMDSFEEYGLTMIGLEDTPPIDKARLGLPGRDEQIENLITQVQAMGQLGLRTLCYNWMALSSWGRTDTEKVGRGGALVTAYREADAQEMAPLAEPGELSAEQLWDALQYFLDAVIPEAEKAGVRLGMHPDDPPNVSHRNVPRIMNSPASFRRLVEMHPSDSNAITFCQGNFALMDDADIPALIHEFGEAERIAFVHFRDVRGNVADFEETFHDEGKTNMADCMRAYYDIGFDGPMRPDHVPTMYGEPNTRPGYETMGRLFALGYIRGLEQATATTTPNAR